MTHRSAVDPARRGAGSVAVAVGVAAGVAVMLSLSTAPRSHATADVPAGDEPQLSVDAAVDVPRSNATSTNAESATVVANRAVASSSLYESEFARSVRLVAFVGLVIGVVAALFVAWRDLKIRSERQLEKVTGVANLAVIPLAVGEARPDDVAVLRDEDSIATEAYRALQAQLDVAARKRPFGVLLVTSARAGEGTSSVAANLAAAVAQSGRRVVVVDGDLRRPQVHKLFEIGNDVGLSSVVMGEAPLQQCVQRLDHERNVALLTAGSPPPCTAEMLSDERLRRVLESLARASDLVVIDAPPVLPTDDPIILAEVADATLLVATARSSARRGWNETLERLNGVGANVIGTVLLRPDARAHATSRGGDAATTGPASRRAAAAPTVTDSDDAAVDATPAEARAADGPYPWDRPAASDRVSRVDSGDNGESVDDDSDADRRAG